MKVFAIALLLVGVAFAMPGEDVSEEDFEKKFNILDNDPKEKAEEADNLKKAEDQINEENKKFEDGKASFKEKLYPDSDLPKEEFEKEKEGANMPTRSAFLGDRVLGVFMPPAHVINDPENAAKLDKMYAELEFNRQSAPASIDYAAMGFVTKAKNQQSCGSCAAFAATGLHETCMLKAGATYKGLDLSEQYLVDCGYNAGSMNACNGAYPHAYPDWFAKDGGVSPHEVKYPYLNRNPKKTCPSGVPKWNSGAKVSSSVYDYGCNADKLKSLVASKGAVAVALYASDSAFSNYASGVMSGCSTTKINHAVLVVGYGTENGVDYWLVKNSWGANWGAKGFIKIKRGSNECGIEGICVTSDCTLTGSADPAPVAPPKPPIPAALYCNISGMFGSGITGTYTLRVGTSTGLITSKCKCNNSVCTPAIAGPSNACMYICGQTKCG